MNTIVRILVACGCIAAAQTVVVAIHQGMDPEPAAIPVTGADTLPSMVGDYLGRDEPIDEKLVRAADSDIMLNRVFENQLGDRMIANVGIWVDYGRGIPHKPDECYPSAGWEIANRQMVNANLNGHGTFKFKRFIFQRGTSRIAVAYWVHVGDQIITESESLRGLRQQLRGTGGNLPPLVKVMLQTDARNVEQADARLSRFVAALAPHTAAIQ